MSSRHGPNARRLPLPTPLGPRWFRKHVVYGAAGGAVQGTILRTMRKGGLDVCKLRMAIRVEQTSKRRSG